MQGLPKLALNRRESPEFSLGLIVKKSPAPQLTNSYFSSDIKFLRGQRGRTGRKQEGGENGELISSVHLNNIRPLGSSPLTLPRLVNRKGR